MAEGADPEDFGFNINTTLKKHWSEVMERRIALMGFGSEKVIHWPHIRKRMAENYEMMNQDKKEFVDWFLSFDFDGAKKRAVRRYYLNNFFSILKRKLRGICH